MEDNTNVADRIREMGICVIIPTYNNEKTLQRVIDAVLIYTQDIIVVNDGATDSTSEILKIYPGLHIITHPRNLGKGLALRHGFSKAVALKFNYAITIDSDGQHYASDIPSFIGALHENRNVLLIGSRNMAQQGVPKKSSFGNKFSNFWFWFETGARLTDTQSGYRLYPLWLLEKQYYTTKFEFEIEVIVRAAWRGVPVTNIPVGVLYDPAERVSHFRPFRDFSRISVLNTVLVVITIIYIKPRDFIRTIQQKGLRKFVLENLIESKDSNAKKALSVALGVFIGISPFWGLQSVLAISLAVLFRLNKTISFLFSNVSIPPMIPFIIYGSLLIGGAVFPADKPLVFNANITLSDITYNMAQYLAGSFILAIVMAVVSGISAYTLLTVTASIKSKV